MNKTEQIKAFLQSHTLINIRGLEQQAAVPEDTVKKFLYAQRGLPAKHIPAIEKVLQEYGYIPEEVEK